MHGRSYPDDCSRYVFAPLAADIQNVKGLSELLNDNPDAKDALQKKFQLPLRVMEPEEDEKGEKPFLLCRYNRVGDKHRSPWTNNLYPKSDDNGGKSASAGGEEDDELRLLEAQVNEVWDAYKNLYYGHEAVGSVYLKETDKGAFEGVFCIQKKCSAGSWDSIHFVHVDEPQEKTCNYRVESSALVVVNGSADDDNKQTSVDTSASLSKETNKTCKISPTMMTASHIENVGELIEANEIDLRSSLERVHIPKTQEIVDDIKKSSPKMPTGANPLMGMIMGSDVLKKKKLQDS